MVTIQVKLHVPICGPEGTFKPDEIVFLSEPLARALVAAGQAELVGVVPAEKTVEIYPTQSIPPEVKAAAIVPEVKVEEIPGVRTTLPAESLDEFVEPVKQHIKKGRK